MMKALYYSILLLMAVWISPMYASPVSNSKIIASYLQLSPDAYAFPSVVCEGGDVQLFASGGTAYSWTGPNGFTSNLQNPVITGIQLNQSGTYTVIITTGGGPVTQTVGVRVELVNVPDLADITGCVGDQISSQTIPNTDDYNVVKWVNDSANIGLYNIGYNTIPAFTLSNPYDKPITSKVNLTTGKKIPPTDPVSITIVDRTSTWSNVQLNNGTNFATVAPGATVNFKSNLNITAIPNMYCPGCVVQYYLGVGSTQDDIWCQTIYVSNGSPYSGSLNNNFTAPTMPGLYFISMALTLDYSCQNITYSQDPFYAVALLKVEEPPVQPNPSLAYDVADKHVSITNMFLDGVKVRTVAPSASVNLTYDLAVTDLNNNFCSNQCVVQFYAGLGGTNTTLNCVSTFVPLTQSNAVTFTAPSTPGAYYVVNQSTLQYNCVPQSFANSPDNATALLIVQDPNVCDPVNSSFTITAFPETQVDSEADQVVCEGSPTADINFTGVFSDLAWTNDEPGIGLAASGSGDILSFTATNNTNAPIVAHIQAIGSTNTVGDPRTMNMAGRKVTYSSISLNGGANEASVAPGSSVNLTFNAVSVYTGYCPGCFYQQYIGIGGTGTTIHCFNSGGTSTQYYSGNDNFTAPSTPGVYYLTFGGSLQYYCVPYNFSNEPNLAIAVLYVGVPMPSMSCSDTIDFTITVNPTPDATATPSAQTICSGAVIQTIALTGSVAGTTFDWTRDNTSNLTGIAASGSGDITGALTNTTNTIQTTTFTITPTANGCTGTPITATVTVNPTPDVSANPANQTICSGSTITTIVLSGSVSGSTFNWTRDNTANITGIAASGSGDISGTLTNTTFTIQTTTFTITPTANGCNGTPITATVTVNPKPNATATPSAQTICSGSTIQSIVLTGSVSGTTYSWTRNNTVNVTGIPASGNGSIISGALTNTTYTIQTVTFTITPTANGCSGTPITATVTVNPTPDVTPTPADQEPCSGKPITPITMSGHVSGTTYLWTRDMPQITGIAMSGSGTISGTLYNNGSTPVTVTFTITPWANGCPGLPKTATVTVYPLPHAQAEAAPNPACEGELTWFNATGGVQYHWSGPGGFTFDGGRFGRNMELNMAGTYFVTVTSSHGCTSTASVTVSVKPAPVPTISISPNPACTGNTVQLSATGGTGYKWSGPNGFTSTQQNPVITNVKLYQAGTYTVTVTGANSCTASISTNLTVNETPVGSAWYDEATSCAGSTLHLYATGGGTYQWTGPAGFSSTQQNPTRANLNSTHSGIYTVVITGLYGGCTSSYSVNVQVHPLPAVTAWTTTPEVCEGDAAYLFASGGSTYQWSGPYGYLSNFQNPVIYNIPAYMDGIYTVIASSKYGCTASASVYIDVQTVNAIVNATPNPVPYGGTLYLTASGGESYLWTGPNGFHTTFQNPIIYKFTSVNAGLYACVVSTRAGCQDTEIILVQVKDRGLQDEPQLETRTGKYVQVFPNPAKDMIRLVDHYTGTMNYTIIDAQGNAIQQGKTTSGDQISIDQLNAGSYYIQWTYTIDGKLQSNISKFIKVR